MPNMIVYLAAPVRPVGTETLLSNLHRAKRWYHHVIQSYPHAVPVAPWITTCEVLDDSIEADRARGIAMNSRIISRCDSLWLVGPRVSSGMRAEGELALSLGIPVFSYVQHGAEPPESPKRLEAVPWRAI